MNRESLVRRNRSMTEAFHTQSLKHQLRRAALNTAGLIPIPRSRWATRNRILLMRPDHLGDVLLTTPAILALRQTLPYTEIHALVGPWSAETIASYPEIDQVLTLPFPGFSRQPKDNWHSPYQLAVSAARHIRRIGYGSAVILRPDHWWGALVARLAGIPERIGYNLPDVAPFLTRAVDYQNLHAVEQSLRLVERWTGAVRPEETRFYFPVELADQNYIDGYLQEWDIRPGQPVLCIHPGTGTAVKHWDETRWARAADALTEQLDAPVVLTGGDHELPLTRRIAEQMRAPAVVMAGDTRVGQLAALFKRARAVLGPDSGPLHLAVAVGTPTVALYGPADPAEFGSWGSPARHAILTSDIGCRPCRVLDWSGDDPQYHPCVRDISLAAVLETARRVVQDANPG